MAVFVHPSAVVEPGAVLGEGVHVGPLCYVGGEVELGACSKLVAHATILGRSVLGPDNQLFPAATLGAPPQDRSYAGEPTRLEIGSRNVFREGVTVHCGTVKGAGVTRIGSGCLLMAGAHVAHDCVLEDRVVLTNHTVLGGHVVVEEAVTCGGHVAVAPFVRLGRLCFAAGGACIEHNVPPFVIVSGDRARVRALNVVGLRRAGVPEASMRALKDAFKQVFGGKVPRRVALETLDEALVRDEYVAELVAFVRR
ncbi:MAG: acyl-ACP--UDP-N-acetylglucosamine O-acyltransferase [Polyangiaceae bacterium]|nr:acyl-ACP--UDP-N-acetylglucosamine O-acyltransferase [Polyangiaceae bacterium]